MEIARNKDEGWTWVQGSKKWHYFRGKHSLCGKWMIWIHPEEGYEVGGDDHSNNCAACRKKIAKEKERDSGASNNNRSIVFVV